MPKPDKADHRATHPTLVAGDGAPEQDTDFETMKDDLNLSVDTARDQARRLGNYARTHGSTSAERRKGRVADAIAEAARTLRGASASRDGQADVQSILDRTAETLDDISDRVRATSFADLYETAEDYARERPLLVAGCAVLAGFALSRIVSGRVAAGQGGGAPRARA